MTEKLESFIADLQLTFPDAEIRHFVGNNGAFMVDVRRDGRMFGFASDSQGECGFDEIKADDGFGMGYANVCPDFEEAVVAFTKRIHDSEASGD